MNCFDHSRKSSGRKEGRVTYVAAGPSSFRIARGWMALRRDYLLPAGLGVFLNALALTLSGHGGIPSIETTAAVAHQLVVPLDYATIQDAVNATVDRDTILVLGSSFPYAGFTNDPRSGNGGANLYIRRADYDSYPQIRGDGLSSVVIIGYADSTRLEGFDIDGNGTLGSRAVHVSHCPAIITDCYIHGAVEAFRANTGKATVADCTMSGFQDVLVAQSDTVRLINSTVLQETPPLNISLTWWGYVGASQLNGYVIQDDVRYGGGSQVPNGSEKPPSTEGSRVIHFLMFNSSPNDWVIDYSRVRFPQEAIDYFREMWGAYGEQAINMPNPWFRDALTGGGPGRVNWWEGLDLTDMDHRAGGRGDADLGLQCLPNPVLPHGAVSIRYTSAQTGPVAIGLYDVQGRRLARLFEGIQNAGRNEVRVNLSGLAVPAGHFYIGLQAAGQRLSGGMIVR